MEIEFKELIVLIGWLIVFIVPVIVFSICTLRVIWKGDAHSSRGFLLPIISKSNTLHLAALFFLLMTITVLVFFDKLSSGVIGLLGTIIGYVLGSTDFHKRHLNRPENGNRESE